MKNSAKCNYMNVNYVNYVNVIMTDGKKGNNSVEKEKIYKEDIKNRM